MQQVAAQETAAEAANSSMVEYAPIAHLINIRNFQATMQLEDPHKYHFFHVIRYIAS